MFYVEYKANDNFRITLEKDNKYNATLIDNQSEKEVEVNKFGRVEQDKLNRLGNKMKTIYAVYSYEDIPSLTDYIGRYVLAEREIIYYDDYVVFKGYMFKDYIRKNYYYGLSSRKRFTQISNDPVIRNDVINYDLSFSFEKPDGEDEFKYLKRFLLQPIVSNYYYDEMKNSEELYNEFPKYCFVKTYDKDDNQLQSGYYLLSPTWYACGKTNIIQMQMEDNFNVGTRIETILGALLSVQSLVPYVDNYGEYKRLSIELRSAGKDDFASDWVETGVAFDLNYETANRLPYVLSHEIGNFASKYILETDKVIYKDNRETTAISLNFNFKDSEDIIIGDIAQYTGIGNNENSIKDLKVYFSKKDMYELGDMYGLGETSEYVYVSEVDYREFKNNGTLFSNIRIEAGNGNQGWKSWGLCDKDGRLLVGVNNSKNYYNMPTSIFLKCEKKDY